MMRPYSTEPGPARRGDPPATDGSKPPLIVVLGAGFAGLNFCRKLKGDARILLIDKNNHHLFQPLLYQVAMAGLSVPDVAEPIRTIFRRDRRVETVMDTVERIDLDARRVHLTRMSTPYDTLVIAMGGRVSYFGNDHWDRYAPGLKSIEDAMRMRRRILTSFEMAESTADDALRKRLMTIVVVGGGPTGVELAGAMAELCRKAFRRDFRRIDTSQARVLLVDGGDRLLKAFPPELSDSARRQLEQLGVEVVLSTRVSDMQRRGVTLSDGRVIETDNILWGGGIQAIPVTHTLGVELGHGGRVRVGPDLSIPGYPEVFAIGDIADARDDTGQEVPNLAPAAMQMGKHVARTIGHELRHGPRQPGDRPAFRYWDKGIMATIGRKRAVAWLGRLRFSGLPAWVAWLVVHLSFLIGFRNRLVVLIQWFYAYVSFAPGARILYDPVCEEQPERPTETDPPKPRDPDPAEAPS